MNRCAAGLGNGVTSVAQIDRVVPDHAAAVMLVDGTRTLQGEVIVSGADGHGSVATDDYRVTAITGDDRTIAVNVDEGFSAPRNAD